MLSVTLRRIAGALSISLLAACAAESGPERGPAEPSDPTVETLTGVRVHSAPGERAPTMQVDRDQIISSDADPPSLQPQLKNQGWCCDSCDCQTVCVCTGCHSC